MNDSWSIDRRGVEVCDLGHNSLAWEERMAPCCGLLGRDVPRIAHVRDPAVRGLDPAALTALA